MWQTVIGVLPAAVAGPITAILVSVDAHLLFAVMWALAALVVGAVVRNALAKREERFTRISSRAGQGSRIVTTRSHASRAA